MLCADRAAFFIGSFLDGLSLWASVLLFSRVQRLHQKPPGLLPDVTFELQRAQDHEAIKQGTDTKSVILIVHQGQEFRAWSYDSGESQEQGSSAHPSKSLNP